MKKKLLLLFALMLAVPAWASPRLGLDSLRVELQKTWPHNRTLNLVFHGHSVPSGYANTPNVRTLEAYPHRVFHALKQLYPYAVLNVVTTSIGGEQSEQGEARFDRDVLPLRPDVLFIDYALNDRSIGLERARVAWQKMIVRAQAQGIPVVLLTPTPDLTEDILDDRAPLQQHSEQIRRLAREYHTGLVDCYAAFRDLRSRGFDLKDYMSQSNHPNANGHRVAADLIMRHLLDDAHWRDYQREQTLELAHRVARNQLTRFEAQCQKGSRWDNSHARWAWTTATMYVGLASLARQTDDPLYWNFLRAIGQENGWKPGPDTYSADDMCVAQTYAMLFEHYGDSAMLRPTLAVMDSIITHPRQVSLDFHAPGSHSRWCWCDALFMAPTAYARMARLTGEEKYLDFMDHEFRLTCDTLYDEAECLFYRDTRYKTQREANGQKVFWGRGNGWVAAALAIVLEHLPQERATTREYEKLYRQLMGRVAALQDKNGFWHSSLLHPEAYPMPETSATALFTYSLLWGVNHGLLDRDRYLPVALKGWQALQTVVDADGFVGYVQPIGADPKSVGRDDTEVYGTGAFLLAACEYLQLIDSSKQPMP